MSYKPCSDIPDIHKLTVENESSELNIEEMDETSLCLQATNDKCESTIDILLRQLPELDNCFEIHGKIGEGTFSSVYQASLKGSTSDKRFAIKHLTSFASPKWIKSELDCLNRIGGQDNVVSCEMTLRQDGCVVFVMPYLQHHKFSKFVREMSVEETRLYMKNLFLALKRVHSFNIIHRDIKPSNFLYNRDSKQFLLIDFGLAHKVRVKGGNSRVKPPISKITTTKRKRVDDDVENLENSILMSCTLQTSNDSIKTIKKLNDLISVSKQNVTASASLRTTYSNRYSKQPLSSQLQRWQQVQPNHVKSIISDKEPKHLGNTLKRQPLTANSTNVITNNIQRVVNQKHIFHNLMPQKVTSVDTGASFVRVQNSRIQPRSQFLKPSAPVRHKGCSCKAKSQVCNICLARKALHAPRAGTPGFRPPEVLLKYPYQTTAVDMWSAGVIMLSILSGCYPFFKSSDDITALAEHITMFGSSSLVTLAKRLGRNLICSAKRKPLNLKILCEMLRRSTRSSEVQPDELICKECYHFNNPEYGCFCENGCKLDLTTCSFPDTAFDLLNKLLDVNPDTRISAEKALQHPFISA